MTDADETVDRFPPDRATYIRGHATLAAVAMAAGMAILWVAGNPHVWTGAVGGLAAVALRGWYLLDEEMGHCWAMTDTALTGPGGRHAALADLTRVRAIGAAVQIVTRGGDKHLIRWQADPASTIARIEAARARATGDAP